MGRDKGRRKERHVRGEDRGGRGARGQERRGGREGRLRKEGRRREGGISPPQSFLKVGAYAMDYKKMGTK